MVVEFSMVVTVTKVVIVTKVVEITMFQIVTMLGKVSQCTRIWQTDADMEVFTVLFAMEADLESAAVNVTQLQIVTIKQ